MPRPIASLAVLAVLIACASGAEAASKQPLDVCVPGKDPDAAIAACTEILNDEKISVGRSNIIQTRGLAYFEKGDFEHAIEDFTRAMEIDPKNSYPFANRGMAYVGKGDYEQAVADCTRAIELDPGNARAFVFRAAAYMKAGKPDLARADLKNAPRPNLEDEETKSALLAELDKTEAPGRAPGTPPASSTQPSATPGSQAAEQQLVKVCISTDFDAALAACTQLLDRQTTDADRSQVHFLRGAVYLRKGDRDQAIADFTRAVEINPRNADAFYARGICYNELSDWDHAIADLTRSIELDPNKQNAFKQRAMAYLKTNKFDLSRADFDKALQLKPDDEDAKGALAEFDKAGVLGKAAPPPSASPAPAQQAAPAPAPAPVAASVTTPPGKRVALVIGNSQYRSIGRLDNPVNDAKLMADALKELGFKLVGDGPQLDLDKASFDSAVQSFGNQLQGAEVGLFYYAGHGLQVHGTNYLVPVSANPAREADVDFQMVDAGLVLRQMEAAGTKLNVVMLDACRNNPFGGRGLRASVGGLAQMQAPEGTLISYATQPGNVAQDGTENNSPYTKALAEILRKPGLDVLQAFNQVGVAVKKATGGAQQPWVSNSPIEGVFSFKPAL